VLHIAGKRDDEKDHYWCSDPDGTDHWPSLGIVVAFFVVCLFFADCNRVSTSRTDWLAFLNRRVEIIASAISKANSPQPGLTCPLRL
jgi:hypothetical protein